MDVSTTNLNTLDLMTSLGISHLNFFERAWVAWYEYMRNDNLATGIFFFAMHETVYFSRCLILLLLEKISYFRRWKIQDVCSSVTPLPPSHVSNIQ